MEVPKIFRSAPEPEEDPNVMRSLTWGEEDEDDG